MIPADFEREIKNINPKLYLIFNNKLKKFQIKTDVREYKKYAPITINNERIGLSEVRNIPAVVKTIDIHEDLKKVLFQLKKDEWYNRHLSAYGYTKLIQMENQKQRELDEKKSLDNTNDFVSESKNQIFGKKLFQMGV